MENNKEFDSKGREILKKIKRKKYIIEFIKQENLEKNLDSLYEVIAELLVEEAIKNREEQEWNDYWRNSS